MEGRPPWTLFEPGDRLARFLDRGADGPRNKVCIFPPPVQPADEIDSSGDSSGSAIHCLPAGDGTRTRYRLCAGMQTYRMLLKRLNGLSRLLQPM